MTLHRFFVDAAAMAGERFVIPPGIERQVRSVLRLRDGERIVLLPGDGSEAVCVLEAGWCVVEQRREVRTEPRHRLTLAQALLKGDALEGVVQQATELGVAAIRLIVTDRCVARDISPRRLERLRAIARESAEQSERGRVPGVEGPVALDAVLSAGAVLLFERHDGQRITALPPPDTLVIGPEGGFTPDEVRSAHERGVALASLGPRILRSATVGPAATAVVLSATGDFA